MFPMHKGHSAHLHNPVVDIPNPDSTVTEVVKFDEVTIRHRSVVIGDKEIADGENLYWLPQFLVDSWQVAERLNRCNRLAALPVEILMSVEFLI